MGFDAYNSGIKPLSVNTFFKGKRHLPDCRGSVNGIGDTDFTPEALILGFVYGVCSELYDNFSDFSIKKNKIVISGNTVQRNPIFTTVLSDIAKKSVNISQNKEEAAIGAARFSASTLCNL